MRDSCDRRDPVLWGAMPQYCGDLALFDRGHCEIEQERLSTLNSAQDAFCSAVPVGTPTHFGYEVPGYFVLVHDLNIRDTSKTFYLHGAAKTFQWYPVLCIVDRAGTFLQF